MRPLPIDTNAVDALMGTLLTFPDTFDAIATIVSPDDLHRGSEREIFAAAKLLHEAGEPVSVVTLAAKLGNKLEDIGGPPELLRLIDRADSPHNAQYLAKIVHADADRLRVLELCQRMERAVHDRGNDVAEVITDCRSRLDAIEDGNENIDGPTSAADGIAKVFEHLVDDKPETVVSTGYDAADRLLAGGFRGGELEVIAARPGMGKSALVANIAGKVADSGTGVLFFSLEQPRRELLERILSSVSRVSHEKIRRVDLNEQDQFAVSEAGSRIAGWPLFIDDKARRTVDQIAAIARRHKRRHGLGLVVIDYLQLITPSDLRVHREQQVATISRQLKLLAKDDLGVPVIVLAQLSREIEKRDDKRPKLSDLRESGAIEQDADIVMFVDRPAEYDRNALASDASLYVRKNRHGERGTVPLFWRADTLTFMPGSHG